MSHCLNYFLKNLKKQAPLSNYFCVLPPTKKHKTEPESQKKCVFSDKWLQNVDWHQKDDDQTESWCKLCLENPILADKTSTFYMGTGNLIQSAFDKHANRREHQRRVQMIDNNFKLQTNNYKF